MQTCKFPGRLLFRLTALSLAMLSLLAVLLLLLQPALSAQAAPLFELGAGPSGDFYFVESAGLLTIDPDDDSSSGVGGVCTLRDAISAVNAGAGEGFHANGCWVVASGPGATNDYVIWLPDNYTYTLSAANGELLTTANNLFIWSGSGSQVIQANAAANTATYRVLRNNGANVSLNDLTIQNGQCIVASSICGGSNRAGGGIYNQAGVVELNNVIVKNNRALDGGGIENEGTLFVFNSLIGGANGQNRGISIGGGILNNGLATISNTTVSYNNGGAGGGGIYNSLSSGTAVITIEKSIISNNFNNSASSGGGILNLGAGMLITNATVISNNTAGRGGGINSEGVGDHSIVNSTIISNSSTATTSGAGGGGIDARLTLDIIGSTIMSNTSVLSGGGIYIQDLSQVSVTGSRILYNTSNRTGGAVYTEEDANANGIQVTGGCIVGNSSAAFYNNQAVQQTATGNWWGVATGPNTTGADTTSGNVDTSGYLTASPFAECPTISQGPDSNAVYLPIIMTPPPGIIKGRITDATTGQPPQTYVSAYAYNATTGEPLYLEADKDGNGNYTLEVPPGSYKIEFGGNEYVYQFYNNKSTLQTANIITVASGQTVSNINAALVPDPQ